MCDMGAVVVNDVNLYLEVIRGVASGACWGDADFLGRFAAAFANSYQRGLSFEDRRGIAYELGAGFRVRQGADGDVGVGVCEKSVSICVPDESSSRVYPGSAGVAKECELSYSGVTSVSIGATVGPGLGPAKRGTVGGTDGLGSAEGVGGGGESGVGAAAESILSGASGVSSKTLANREKRQKAKLRKQRKQFQTGKSEVPEWRRKDKVVGVDVTPARYVAGLINADNDAELKASVKAKWIAKNKLEAAKAEREFAVLEGVDVSDAVRKQNVVVRSAIERGLVAIEKSHASLRGADVHSSDDETRVHTMLSGSSGSISPNSSVSEAELRAMIARDAELERKNVELEKRVNDLIAQMTKGGAEVKSEVPAPKSMWTVDEHGELLQEHQDAFFDSGYCFTTGDTVPRRCADGKMRTYVNYF